MTGRAHRTTDLASYDTDRRHFRRSYIRSNAFEAFVAFAAMMAGIAFLLIPDAIESSTVARNAGALSAIWGWLYGAGGLVVLVGLLVLSVRIEITGLFLLAAAAAIDGIALLLFQWPVGIRAGLLYLAFVAAAATRAHLAVRLGRSEPGV
jgi:hypothetical protein